MLWGTIQSIKLAYSINNILCCVICCINIQIIRIKSYIIIGNNHSWIDFNYIMKRNKNILKNQKWIMRIEETMY